MLNRKSLPKSANQAGGRYELLYALNEAATALQRSARSEVEVLRVFCQQIEKLGLRGGISLLDERGQNLVIRAFAPVSRLLKKYENLTGMRIEGYTFPVSQVEVYRQVLEGGEPVFLAHSNEVIIQLIPDSARRFTRSILRSLGAEPSVYTPIISRDKTVGVLNMVGSYLTPEDLPVVEAFGNHIAVALDNARLFAAMQAEVLERTQMENALRESGAKFMALTENAACSIFIYQGTKFRYVNAAMEAATGYSREQLLEMNFWDVVHADDQELIRQRGLARQRGEQVEQRYEFRIVRSDGEIRWVDFTAVAIEFGGGPAALGSAFDITHRKRMEIALESSERRFRSIVHNSTDGIVLVDEQGVIIEWNMGQEQITGVPREEAIGKRAWDVSYELIPEDKKQTDRYVTIKQKSLEFLAQGETYELNKLAEHTLQRSNGELRLIQENKFPIPTENGHMICSVIRDVTELRQIVDENARLLVAERQRRQASENLGKATAALTSTLELDKVLDEILTHLKEVVPYDSSTIFLVDSNDLRIAAARGFRVHHGLVGHRYSVEDVLFEKIREICKPLILRDAQADLRFKKWENTTQIRGWMGVPLIVRGEVIGVITLDSFTVGAYNEMDAVLAETFANQAAIAIENARLFDAEGKRAAELEAIRQAILGLATSLDLHEVLDSILKSVFNLLPEVNNGHIFLYNSENGGSLSFGAALWAEGLQNEPWSNPRQNGLTYTVASSGETIVISDMRKHPLYVDTPEDWAGAIIGLPLKIGSRVVGVMNVSYTQPRQFTASERHLLNLFGVHAAIAIENARLYELAAVERRHLSLLYEVGRELATSLDPMEILKRAVSLTCRALDGLVGQAFLYSEAEDRLRLYAIYGRETVCVDEFNRQIILRPGDGLSGWVAQNRQVVNVADVLKDPRWVHVPIVDEDVRSAISAPILAEERLLGVISVLHMKPAAFSSDQLDLLKAICQEVGLALSNARRYQEVERRLAEMTLIQNLALTFNQRLEVQELLDEVIGQLVQKLGYPHVEIFMVDNDALVQKAHHGTVRLLTSLSLTEGIVGRVARTGEVALIPDVSLDPDYLPSIPETVTELAVPIFHGKVVIGVINIESDRPDHLTLQDRDLLKLLAGQISIALENAVLYERVRQHADNLEQIVAQRTAELVELYELSQEIGFTLSYDDLLAILLSHLRSAMNCDLVLGCLLVDGYDRVAIDSERLITLEVIEELKTYCSKALPEQPVWNLRNLKAPDKLITPQGNGATRRMMSGLGSKTIAPITVFGDPVGFLMAGSELQQEFSIEHNRLLDTFANHAAAAVQRLSSMLAAEQKRLESLVEHLPTGVLFLDADYRLLVANPLGREMLALLCAEQPGNRVLSLGPLSIQELVDRHTNPVPLEISVEAPARKVFEAQARPVGNTERQWVITLRDVTQEREMQMRIQMQDRLATVGQLAAGIAHDFNNIMAAILVYTDLLTDDPMLPPESRDRLLVIQQQVRRAASLIRQILDFSRRSIMEQSTLDLLPFIKELDRMLARVLPETIQVDLSYHPGRYVVNADPTRLQQVFMNLAVNSRDAMPEGGQLTFVLGSITIEPQDPRPFRELADGNWITIQIKDTGVGIQPEHLPHVFEPFFTTKPVGEGTGLGLAQVYGIIKQHGGFIDVTSQVGRGTTFCLYLPALTEPERLQARGDFREKLDGNGISVLVVEDDRTTLEALRTLLESQNFHVLTAGHGNEALELLEGTKSPISLVVSDLVMPQMGGLPLYHSIQEKWPQTKMLFITGHPMEGESQALLEKGGVKWLQKPFSVNELSQMVKSLLV